MGELRFFHVNWAIVFERKFLFGRAARTLHQGCKDAMET